jgi:hypothetical protein
MSKATTERLAEAPGSVHVAAALRELRDEEAAWTATAGHVRGLRDPDEHRVPILVDLSGVRGVTPATTALAAILARKATHRHEKTSLLRPLRAWSPEAPD